MVNYFGNQKTFVHPSVLDSEAFVHLKHYFLFHRHSEGECNDINHTSCSKRDINVVNKHFNDATDETVKQCRLCGYCEF